MVFRRWVLTASTRPASRASQILCGNRHLLSKQRSTQLTLRSYATETATHTHTHVHGPNCAHAHHDHPSHTNPHQNNSQLHQPPPSAAPHPKTPLPPPPEAVEKARSHSRNLLRSNDHPSHILAPFLPPGPARDLYLSLRALNLSTASIPEQVRTPATGLLRLKFWRDSIDRIFNPTEANTNPTGTSTNTISTATGATEPSLLLLTHILTTPLPANTTNSTSTAAPLPPRLTKSFITRSLAAREGIIRNPVSPFQTLPEMERYAEDVYSGMHYLILELLHQLTPSTSPPPTLEKKQTLEHIASHLGKAMGIVALLRGLSMSALAARTGTPPNLARNGLQGNAGKLAGTNLPVQLLSKYDISLEHLHHYIATPPPSSSTTQGSDALPTLPDLILEIATLANDHLNSARIMLKEQGLSSKTVGPAVWGSFVQVGVPVAAYLEGLEKAGFDVFDVHTLVGTGKGMGGVLGGWRLP
ncbi:Squalene/phytoene synthase-domain-containing protein, partial [Peziza echinospora]